MCVIQVCVGNPYYNSWSRVMMAVVCSEQLAKGFPEITTFHAIFLSNAEWTVARQVEPPSRQIQELPFTVSSCRLALLALFRLFLSS